MGIPLRIRFYKLNRKMEKWKNGKMEFLCKSNAKKLASFAETPPKITTKVVKMEKWKNGIFEQVERKRKLVSILLRRRPKSWAQLIKCDKVTLC